MIVDNIDEWEPRPFHIYSIDVVTSPPEAVGKHYANFMTSQPTLEAAIAFIDSRIAYEKKRPPNDYDFLGLRVHPTTYRVYENAFVAQVYSRREDE